MIRRVAAVAQNAEGTFHTTLLIPCRLPTAWLTMPILRHTCITALHDAGCVCEQIRANTIASINEVLDRYTKLTADQAGAALERRLVHENGSVQGLFGRPSDVSRNGPKR
jgi:hypothetical protein